MKKVLTTLVMALCLMTKLFGQAIPIDIVERINTVDYIFEGYVIEKHTYQTSDQRKIYTTNLIEITKVLKGNLSCGTVEMITTGGTIGEKRIYSDHLLEVDIDGQGIFLCKETNKELPNNSPFSNSNSIYLDGVYENQSFIIYTEENNNFIAHDITGNYDSLIQFYTLAQIITGFNFIDCNTTSLLKQNKIYQPDTFSYNPEIFTTNNQQEFIENKNWITIQKQSYTRKKTRSTNTINYSMTTPITTGTSPKYCEFDILISDNLWTKYLDIAYLRIEYPNNVFGTNIVSNGKITVTRGNLISNPACYSNPVPNDIGNNSINIPITETVYSQCKNQITSIFQQLIHVKIEVQNCISNQDISIKDSIAFGGFSTFMTGSAYAEFPNDTFSTEYDTFSVANIAKTPNCSATILDFWPKTLHGGVGDTLFVQGYLFRDSMGTGGLYFVDANNPNAGFTYKLKKKDIISWTDTLIKLKVPSIDSNISLKTLASGYFKIINNLGQADTTDSLINVVYSLRNRVDSAFGTKNNVLLYGQNIEGGYDFYVDTSVSNKPLAYAAIKKALNEWVCATGVNYRIIGDTSGLSKYKADDGINLITFGPLPKYAAAAILTDDGGCLSSSPYQHLITDVDIIISDSILSWHYDTLGNKPSGTVDFYAVMLHEFGHCIGHKHVNDATALMNYTTPFTTATNIPYNQRNVNLLTQFHAVKGGQRQVNMSSYAPNFVLCPGNQMIKLPICESFGTLGIDNKILDAVSIHVFPNPYKNTFNIQSDYPNLIVKNIKVYTVNGTLIYSKIFNNNISIKQPLSIEVAKTSSSLMYVLIETNNGTLKSAMLHE